jgi:hypothetical protein
VNVLQTREAIKNGLELVTEGLLGELDLTSVETCAAKISVSDHALSITPISLVFFWMEVATLNTATGINE